MVGFAGLLSCGAGELRWWSTRGVTRRSREEIEIYQSEFMAVELIRNMR